MNVSISLEIFDIGAQMCWVGMYYAVEIIIMSRCVSVLF